MFGRTRDLGDAGEKEARRFLRRAGYRILDRNYRCPLGELDLVALDHQTIVFVEVKTLRDDAAANPEDRIDRHKQRQMLKAARHWLQRRRYPRRPYRFDAVSVVLPADGPVRVRHILEAFTPSE